MALPEDFLLELKSRADIEQILSPYVNLKRRGSNLVGLCPFHNEKTPSFTVYPQNGSYYCFGCGAGGDAITFIRQIEHFDYIEAVRALADRVGLQMPETEYDDSFAKLKVRLYEINREAARFYHNYLLSDSGKPMLDYLLGRQMSLKTIKHFGLGAAPDSWDALKKHLLSKGFTVNEMLQADILSRSKNGGTYDRFRKRVMFPIIDIRGNVIGFGGRAMPGEDKKGAKYINTTDTPIFKKSQNLYALNFAKSSCAKRLILAEGYMDVIALHQAGFENAVAALGTAFGEGQARLMSRYTEEVVVTMDADGAGKKATDRALKVLSDAGLPARVLRIPDGKDPDEFIKNKGASSFGALLDGAVSDIEYKLYLAAEGIDSSTDNGRLEYLKKTVEILSEIDDEIAVDLYASRLADRFGIGKSAILSRIKQLKEQNVKKKQRAEIRKIISPAIKTDEISMQRRKNPRATAAEETVISILIYNPDLYDTVLDNIKPEDFINPFNKRVFEAISDIFLKGQHFDLALLGESFTAEEVGFIAGLQNRSVKGENAKIELFDCFKVILEEKEKNTAKNAEEMSVDEWADSFKKIAEKRKGN